MQRLDLERACGSARPIIGMVHLPPLPGAPGHGGMDAVLARARADAAALQRGGVDAIMVENFGDTPFHPGRVPPATCAALALAVAEVRRVAAMPVGVNVLRNDALTALAIAAAAGATFIRVNVHTGAMLTDQGWIQGMAHDTVRERERLAPHVAILADVMVKHAVPPAGLAAAAAARDTWERGRADGLIVTGAATGAATDAGRLREVRAAVPDAPIIIGSGVSAGNAAELLRLADGAIIGSAIMQDGRAGAGIDEERLATVMAAVRAATRG